MPQYATTSDLASVGIPAQALSGVSAGDQDAALVAASRLIDSFISSHVTTPMTTYGQDITQACVDLAAYRLMVKRGYNPDASQAFRLGYEDALRWLDSISRGRALPSGMAGASATTEGPVITSDEVRWTGEPSDD